MKTQRWIQRTVPLAAAALVGAAPMAFAQWGRVQSQQTQGQELFQWAGRVDREVQVVMRGSQLSTRNVGNAETGRARTRVMMQLPRQDGEVVAQVLNGRGDVDVVQQPNAQNGYTAVLRIVDGGAGSDNYRVVAYWQNYANGDYVGNGNGARNRGRARGRVDDNYPNYPRNPNYPNYPSTVYPRSGTVNQSGFHWTGNVDGDLEIRIQNGQISYRNLSGAQPTSMRIDRGNMSLPRNDAQAAIAQVQGRGSVSVVQQPSSWNGYTTVIRVRDPQGGYGYYDFDLVWR